MEAIHTYNRIGLKDAMALLNVSESTARRLFSKMENSGNVIRTHGGIQFIDRIPREYSYDLVEIQNVPEKKKIAAAAAELVNDGDVIYLDSGTTLAYMSEILASKILANKLKDVVIFTNSLVNLNYLIDAVKVTFIGGYYRENRRDFCGYIAENTVKDLNFLKCFLGADGYSIQAGFTAIDFSTARLNELILNRSSYRVVLANADKFHGTTMISYSRNQNVDLLITDKKPEESVRRKIESLGTKIQIAEE